MYGFGQTNRPGFKKKVIFELTSEHGRTIFTQTNKAPWYFLFGFG